MNRIDVKVGDMVKKDQSLGVAGATGMAGGVHVHFSMQIDGVQVNPREWWDEHWIHDRILSKLDPNAAQAQPVATAAAVTSQPRPPTAPKIKCDSLAIAVAVDRYRSPRERFSACLTHELAIAPSLRFASSSTRVLFSPHQTRQAFWLTIGCPALHENAFWNSGDFCSVPFTR